MKEQILKKETMFCPLCCKKHELIKIERENSMLMHGKHIRYTEQVYRCKNMPEEERDFMTGEMMNQSLQNARDSYAKKYH